MKDQKILQTIAKRIEKIANDGAGRVSVGRWHQPKVPQQLKDKK